MADELEEVNRSIQSLEKTEAGMLGDLQRSINEHNRLLSMSKTGDLDSMRIRESKQRLNVEIGKSWH